MRSYSLSRVPDTYWSFGCVRSLATLGFHRWSVTGSACCPLRGAATVDLNVRKLKRRIEWADMVSAPRAGRGIDGQVVSSAKQRQRVAIGGTYVTTTGEVDAATFFGEAETTVPQS